MKTISFSPTNFELENTSTSDLPEEAKLKKQRTFSAWFVVILGKLGFFNKLGVVFWSLVAPATQVYGPYK